LVAETHVIWILVVEGNPLGLAVAFDVGERNFAVVAVDAGYDYTVAAEGSFLVECVAGGCGILAVVGCAIDSCDFSGPDVEIVDVVPFQLDGLLLLVDFERQPDVARLPEGDGVPLIS
jgi:hypothetical protein